ncbi:cuticle-degrading serine protease [Drechslerella dactyloides]|uniref:Cuticle-degrading serine protease n=2 Tax=Drechslerella dactyloides TaxID=74499 RepID=A0AAD6NGJ8_DREDA|nr:cuticle-degrading serine protease [Drechslerella dactyloides]
MFSQGLISLLAIAGLATNAAAGPVLRVTNAGAAGAIADKYIVVLKKGLTDAAAQAHESRISSFHSNVARDLSGPRSHGVQNQFKFASTGFRGYSGGFDTATLQQILRSPEVDYVEQDLIMTTSDTQEGATWGLSRVSQTNFDTGSQDYKYYYNGATAGLGATVYVIDTGVRITHNEFQVKGKRGRDASRATWGFNAVDKSDSDGNGHGTHCAGTIAGNTYGVAKKAKIVAVKVLSAGGSGSTSGVINGMNWVAKNAAPNRSVASMSLGGGKSTTINAAVDGMFNAGVVVVVAAGNENQDAANVSPASAPNAITVGAIDNKNKRASFSNYGKLVDVFAPGVDVISAWKDSDGATKQISGTSMACPHVAGLAAYYISEASAVEDAEAATPAQISETISKKATGGQLDPKDIKEGSPNKIGYNGYI